MAYRLLDRLEPDHLDRPTRLVGWIGGGLVGSIVAAAALALVLSGLHIG